MLTGRSLVINNKVALESHEEDIENEGNVTLSSQLQQRKQVFRGGSQNMSMKVFEVTGDIL